MATATKKKGGTKRIISGPPRKGPEMPADGSWAPSVCQYLRKLRVGYERNTQQLTTLVNDRKRCEKDIEAAMEANQPKKLADLKIEHYDIVADLSKVRAQVRWYGDKITTSIAEADQGELFEGARTKPTEADLLFKPSKNAWKEQLIEAASGLEDRVLAALKAVEITTFGELSKHDGPLERIEGLTIADIAAVNAALEKAQRGGVDPLGDDEDDE